MSTEIKTRGAVVGGGPGIRGALALTGTLAVTASIFSDFFGTGAL